MNIIKWLGRFFQFFPFISRKKTFFIIFNFGFFLPLYFGSFQASDFTLSRKWRVDAFVFYDHNKNGVQDFEDIPLPGIFILVGKKRGSTRADGIFSHEGKTRDRKIIVRLDEEFLPPGSEIIGVNSYSLVLKTLGKKTLKWAIHYPLEEKRYSSKNKSFFHSSLNAWSIKKGALRVNGQRVFQSEGQEGKSLPPLYFSPRKVSGLIQVRNELDLNISGRGIFTVFHPEEENHINLKTNLEYLKSSILRRWPFVRVRFDLGKGRRYRVSYLEESRCEINGKKISENQTLILESRELFFTQRCGKNKALKTKLKYIRDLPLLDFQKGRWFVASEVKDFLSGLSSPSRFHIKVFEDKGRRKYFQLWKKADEEVRLTLFTPLFIEKSRSSNVRFFVKRNGKKKVVLKEAKFGENKVLLDSGPSSRYSWEHFKKPFIQTRFDWGLSQYKSTTDRFGLAYKFSDIQYYKFSLDYWPHQKWGGFASFREDLTRIDEQDLQSQKTELKSSSYAFGVQHRFMANPRRFSSPLLTLGLGFYSEDFETESERLRIIYPLAYNSLFLKGQIEIASLFRIEGLGLSSSLEFGRSPSDSKQYHYRAIGRLQYSLNDLGKIFGAPSVLIYRRIYPVLNHFSLFLTLDYSEVIKRAANFDNEYIESQRTAYSLGVSIDI